MSSNNYWLHQQLTGMYGSNVAPAFEKLIEVSCGAERLKIYAPLPEEYIISTEIVEKVKNFGGNIISYPGWCAGVTEEAELAAKDFSITIVKHGALFGMLKRKFKT